MVHKTKQEPANVPLQQLRNEAVQLTENRNTQKTNDGNKKNWQDFVDWCKVAYGKDPREEADGRFPLLVEAIRVFLTMKKGDDFVSINVADKARNGLADYYKTHFNDGQQWNVTKMLKGRMCVQGIQ
jgi:hypothetical protein